MNSALMVIGWLLVFGAAPFAIGIGICRALRVKEYGMRLGWVIFSIFFFGFAPFAAKVVQEERYGYQDEAGKWVTLGDVKDGTDPASTVPTKVESTTNKPVKKVDLAAKDIEAEGSKWVLVDDHTIEVVKKTTFDLSRWQDALSYGIDLAGGTNLVYELEEQPGETIDHDLMERMVAAVTRRINPAGTKEITVRRVGQKRIEVIIPGADPAVVDETKKLMTELGQLEFSIVANERDHGDMIKLAIASPAKDVVVGGVVRAKWRPVAPIKDAQGRTVPNTEFGAGGEIAVRQMAGRSPGFNEVLIIYEPEESKQITGKLLKRANPTSDGSGRPAVGFHFNQSGAYLFSELTTQNRPRKDGSKRQLAVLLNGEVHTAPSINQPIGADGIIESGRFTIKEVNQLVAVLNAGALPVPIKKTPISEFTISPTLGFDVQSKGKLALWVSSVAVIVFMAAYYLIAGLVADFALLMNLLFIVGIMAWVRAAFTLPGLAGLVLSAGMAVDANVLIYERIREETQRGASLRMAIHNGFDKAFAAIFDSNITTLITAVILYLIGTETVKGFAVSLFIGLVVNLYTAVYVSRLILNILERGRVTKRLKMMSLIGTTNFDFVGKQNLAIGASVVLIVAGMVAFVARGQANYDIDFTGGTSVTMQFNDVQKTDEVRDKLEKTFGKNITVEELTPFGAATKGRHFRARIANEGDKNVDQKQVEAEINKTFPGELVRKNVSFGEIKEIAAAKAPEKDEKAEKDSKEKAPDAAAADPFAGGHEVALTFTDDKGVVSEIAVATFSRYLEEQLEAIPAEEGKGKKYAQAESLVALEGTAGSGVQAAEGKVKLFSAIRLKASKAISANDLKTALTAVQSGMKNTPIFDEVTSFEASVAGETKQSAVIAIVASLFAIVAYVWFRFENLVFGIAAVIALLHDVLAALACVALGSYLANTPVGSILLLNDFKINMPMIAAFLTIVGYSINDTIVIFDRMREIRGKNPTITKDIVNLTVNQCLSRTILTALTVFITVLILYALGGEGIHGFAYCMVVGSIAGTYSTVYIASPLVLFFLARMDKKPASSSASPAELAKAT